MNGRGDKVNIICTQPRRVAATSVAERVAEEMNERYVSVVEQTKMGLFRVKVNCFLTSPLSMDCFALCELFIKSINRLGNQVGYQIRMESKRSKNTKLLFCTTGVILRRLQDDHDLKSITHVIVDEVHERQVQTDVLLIALRQLLRTNRRDLKVILVRKLFNVCVRVCMYVCVCVLRAPCSVHPCL